MLQTPPALGLQWEHRIELILLMGACDKVASIAEDERPVRGPFQADNPSDINDMVTFRMSGNLHAFQVGSA